MSESGTGKPDVIIDGCETFAQLFLKKSKERGDAIVFGPRRLFERYAKSGRLKLMPWPVEGPETRASLIRSRRRLLSPAAERLAELFVDHGSAGSGASRAAVSSLRNAGAKPGRLR